MESNPHAGTGATSCGKCGRRFAYSNHRPEIAYKALAEHECDGHPLTVIGTLKNMCIEREITIEGEFGDGDIDPSKIREAIEEELETKLLAIRARTCHT